MLCFLAPIPIFLEPMLRTIDKTSLARDLVIDYDLTIRAPLDKVFEGLSKSTVIDEWGGGPSRVQAKVHGIISFWDDEMYGNIREIEAPFHLVHTLRHVQWGEKCVDSLVIWSLKEDPRGTLLQIAHKDLPSRKSCEVQEELWTASFLGPLKAYLENHC